MKYRSTDGLTENQHGAKSIKLWKQFALLNISSIQFKKCANFAADWPRSFGLGYILYVCIYVFETAMSIICQRTCALNNIWSPPQYLITENHTPLRVLFTRHFFWYSFETMSDIFYSNTYIQFCAPLFFEKKNIDREAKCSVASEQ